MHFDESDVLDKGVSGEEDEFSGETYENLRPGQLLIPEEKLRLGEWSEYTTADAGR